MAAKEKTIKPPRVIVCAASGRPFEYVGKGRPPLYHPEVAASVKKEATTARRKAKAAEAAAARASARASVASASVGYVAGPA